MNFLLVAIVDLFSYCDLGVGDSFLFSQRESLYPLIRQALERLVVTMESSLRRLSFVKISILMWSLGHGVQLRLRYPALGLKSSCGLFLIVHLPRLVIFL